MKTENKITDHHFKPLNEYKYNLIEVEPRKSYEELQKENEALKLTFQVLKTASELFTNIQKLGSTFQKGGIVNNSAGPEMIYRKCPNCGANNTRKESLASKYTCKYCEGGLND